MLTYTYVSEGKFELMEKPKPVLQHERDAIVKVTLASICSSDLHIKHGSVPRAVPCLMCRSLEQILARVTFTMASRSCCSTGFGFSIRANVPSET